jgi:hypothetical protein
MALHDDPLDRPCSDAQIRALLRLPFQHGPRVRFFTNGGQLYYVEKPWFREQPEHKQKMVLEVLRDVK